MKRHFASAACAAALLLSTAAIDAIWAPAAAQDAGDFDFYTIHDQLAPYGDWVYSDRWGEVWIPTDVPDDFQPYVSDGYWVDTYDYGWMWVSNYPWGDIPFHYGRWINDPDAGWLWIPGYVWSPAWVVWRSNGNYIGWMPMPPDQQFLEGSDVASVGLSIGPLNFSVDFGNSGNYYGYADWYGPGYNEQAFASNWVFVGAGYLGARDFYHYAAPRQQYVTIIHNTTNITNYSVVNNYIVNRSVNTQVVARAAGHPIQMVHAAQVIHHPQWIIAANKGAQIQQRMRTQIPRGMGKPNSAPKPPPQVLKTLSTKVTPRNGHQPTHLYTRDTVANAPLSGKPLGGVITHPMEPHGANPPPGPKGQMMEHHQTIPGGTMSGPNAPPVEHHGTTPGGGPNRPSIPRHETYPGGGKTMEHRETAPSGNMTMQHHAAPPPPKPEGQGKPNNNDKNKDHHHQ